MSPKVIAKFIFDVGQQLEKLVIEYEKLQEIKINAPEYEIIDDARTIQYWKSKYVDLWNKHQQVLRELVELKKK